MTVELSIDQVTFRQLVDVALRRIPTASRGNWTLHAPVDPGIALVELFAWLLEQRSYWADRATEPFVRSVMRLFGETILDARPAGVAVTFEPELCVPLVPNAQVSRRTELRIAETDLVFTLDHGLTALAVQRDGGLPVIELDGVAGYHREDLRSGRPIPILPATGGPGSARLGFVLAGPPPASAGLPVSILFDLDTNVHPQWHPDAAAAQPPAEVAWTYLTTSGDWKPLPDLRDGTLGLRRSGLVRFALPADWSAYGPQPTGWIQLATQRATFSSPPTVLQITPNTTTATHLRWQALRVSPAWQPLPARTLQLAGQPLVDRTFVVLAETAADPAARGRRRWRIVPDFSRSGPVDRVALVDREHARITFGDGLSGRLPRLDTVATDQAIVYYASGGGRAGNLPPRAWETVASELPGAKEPVLPVARSYVASVGGRDKETLDEARARATAALRVPTRPVTAGDHATVACATPGVDVARAHAEVGFKRGECGVVPGFTTVFVVPGIHSRTTEQVRAGTAVVAPAADPGMLAEVRAQLASTRLLGETIVVESAAYVHIAVRVQVAGAPHDRSGLRRRLTAALREYLDPLLGGEDGDGWPFGEPVRPTALLGHAQRAIGDRGDVTRVAIVADGTEYPCEDFAIAPYELVAVDAIDVVIETTPSGEAGLR